MKRTTFAALEIGTYFNANGNRCQKVSTRAALPAPYSRVFTSTTTKASDYDMLCASQGLRPCQHGLVQRTGGAAVLHCGWL
jgi:hypothetical protein